MPRNLPDWLIGYLEYTQSHEATDKLHFWVGATVISAALKRQVFMKRVRYNLYPNLYILIVAESALARKSLAMDLGMKMLRDAVPDVFYISGSMTPEGLVKQLNREKAIVTVTDNGGKKIGIQLDSHVMIHADELAEAFGYDRVRASKFTILLTKIYGAQAEHTHTLSGEGQLSLRNLYPVFIAGTDPTNLKVLPEEAVGGLIGRTIFVTENKIKRSIAWEEEEESIKADKLYRLLKEDLYNISCLSGEIIPTPGARKLFKDWYEDLNKNTSPDRRLAAFRARCHDTALKLATILSVARSDELALDEIRMKAAIKYIEAQLPEFTRVSDWTVTSTYAQNRAKLLEYITRHGGAGSRAQAMKLLGLSLDEITVLEASLENEHTIKIQVAQRNVFYKLEKEE